MVWNKPHQQSFKESMRNKCKTQENSPWKQEKWKVAEIFCKKNAWRRWRQRRKEPSGREEKSAENFSFSSLLIGLYKKEKEKLKILIDQGGKLH